jgi:glycosyltransferase involved in cell wall biosynthesis
MLPVYNAGQYLVQAVESVLNQTFQNFEVLLLNDGSTDNSLQVLESFAARDCRCRVHTGPHRGLVAVRNTGLELAEGEFIILMDADDICFPDRFEKQIRFLKANPECVVVGSRVILIDPEGMRLRVDVDHFEHAEIDAANLTGVGSFICNPAAVIRRSALEKVGAYREGFTQAEDLDLFLRLAEFGRLANLPEILLSYRQHINSIGHVNPEKQKELCRKAVADACERRGLNLREIEKNFILLFPHHTRSDTHRKWGWWALAAGNLHTARKHALHALRHQPVSLENWRLAACALRGH